MTCTCTCHHTLTQIYIMSATLTLEAKWKDGTKKIQKWAKGYVNQAYMDALVSRVGLPLKAFKIVDVNPEHKMAETMKEYKMDCSDTNRDLHLYYFLRMYPGRTIVFVNAISSLRRLCGILQLLQVTVCRPPDPRQ